MDEFKWIKDIDGVSYDVSWCVRSKWYSKRLNRKFKKAVTNWIHPKDIIKVNAVHGVIDRELMAQTWVWITLDTNVGRVSIFSYHDLVATDNITDTNGDVVYRSEEAYMSQFFDKNGELISSCTITNNLTPQMLVEQLNKLGNG